MTDPQFARLMKALGRADTLDDPRFADWPRRIAHSRELHQIIEEALVRESSAEWARRLASADAPAAPVLGIPETVQLEQLTSRDVLQTIDTPYGPLRLAGSGFRLEHGGGSVDRAPATPGQHTDEVLAEAGYSAADIAAMRQQDVV